MNVLLDTHIAIWAVMDSEKLDENLTFINHDGLLKGYNENCVMNV